MEKHGIIQLAVLLSQAEIKLSDHLSRLRDKFDFTVLMDLYKLWTRHLQVKPLIDVFASWFSVKHTKFCMIMRDPLAFAFNTFSISWEEETVYAFPPPHLIHRVIMKAERETSPLLIVYPEIWSAIWFIQIQKMAQHTLSCHSRDLMFPEPSLDPQSTYRISYLPGFICP